MGMVEQVQAGREAWLRERRRGLGGTDAAAILGASKWATEMDVWLEKRGEAAPREDNEAMWWGRELEPLIAKRYELATGRKLWNPETILYHPTEPVLMGTPDRLVVDGGRGVEIKTSNISRAHEWGEAGTDDIPTEYVVQCCHYMLVTGFDVWDLAVLIGGSDFRVYTIRRDLELEATMRARLLEWWQRHVVAGEQPPMSGSRGVREWLGRRFPRESKPFIKATLAEDVLAGRLARARHALEQFEEEKGTVENMLKAVIGEAAGIEGDGWRASWKGTKGREVRDWSKFIAEMIEVVTRSLGGPDPVENRKTAVALVNATLDACTVEQPGARRFLFTQSRGGQS